MDYVGLCGPLFGIGIVISIYFDFVFWEGFAMIFFAFLLAGFIFVEIQLILMGNNLGLDFSTTSYFRMAAHLYLYIIGIFLTLTRIIFN